MGDVGTQEPVAKLPKLANPAESALEKRRQASQVTQAVEDAGVQDDGDIVEVVATKPAEVDLSKVKPLGKTKAKAKPKALGALSKKAQLSNPSRHDKLQRKLDQIHLSREKDFTEWYEQQAQEDIEKANRIAALAQEEAERLEEEEMERLEAAKQELLAQEAEKARRKKEVEERA